MSEKAFSAPHGEKARIGFRFPDEIKISGLHDQHENADQQAAGLRIHFSFLLIHTGSVR